MGAAPRVPAPGLPLAKACRAQGAAAQARTRPGRVKPPLSSTTCTPSLCSCQGRGSARVAAAPGSPGPGLAAPSAHRCPQAAAGALHEPGVAACTRGQTWSALAPRSCWQVAALAHRGHQRGARCRAPGGGGQAKACPASTLSCSRRWEERKGRCWGQAERAPSSRALPTLRQPLRARYLAFICHWSDPDTQSWLPQQGVTPSHSPRWHSPLPSFPGEGGAMEKCFFLLVSHLQPSGSGSTGLWGAPQALH